MSDQVNKKMGRPVTTGKGELLGVRLHPDLLDPLDRFVSDEKDNPSRPEAIRRLLRESLEKLGYLDPPKG